MSSCLSIPHPPTPSPSHTAGIRVKCPKDSVAGGVAALQFSAAWLKGSTGGRQTQAIFTPLVSGGPAPRLKRRTHTKGKSRVCQEPWGPRTWWGPDEKPGVPSSACSTACPVLPKPHLLVETLLPSLPLLSPSLVLAIVFRGEGLRTAYICGAHLACRPVAPAPQPATLRAAGGSALPEAGSGKQRPAAQNDPEKGFLTLISGAC